MKEKNVLSMHEITKSFGTNVVLKGINLNIKQGEVLALIGGNGAGKSTLVKIVMGIYEPDSGDMYIDGNFSKFGHPAMSLEQGVYLVPQEPMLFPHMNIYENVLIGLKGKHSEMLQKLKNLITTLNWNIDIMQKAETLSIADQQLVELLRGLMRKAKLLILDEPTSSLTFNEVKSLFSIITELKHKGIGVIYITHRLTEVFQIATRVAIMRDGKITLDGAVSEFTREMLVAGLLPENTIDTKTPTKKDIKTHNISKKPVLHLENLCGHGFEKINLTVHSHEIVGLAGVVGAGRTELATTIFGRDKLISGKVFLNNIDITGKSTKFVMTMGLAYVAEDRFLNGIFKLSTVAANTTASSLTKIGRGLLNFKNENNITNKFISMFHTKTTGINQLMGALSGGNQQKIVIARSLAINPQLLILDEPTRGIDAAARYDVYTIISELKNQGLAILLISSDMEEIIELSDRVVTMHRGKINGEFCKADITQDNLMAAAFGINKGSQEHA